MTPKRKLESKTAWITGGGTGIGAAVAQRFAEAGANVALTGRRPEPLEVIAQNVGGLAVPADVRDEKAMADAVRMIVDRFGGLDIVIANAGVITEGAVDAMEPDAWQASVDINLTGVMNTLKSAMPVLAQKGSGAVVVVSSVAGMMGVPQSAAYCATKAGVIGLTRSMAVDYGPNGIRVNALCPGWVQTPMSEEEMAALAEEKGISVNASIEAVTRHLPLARMAAPAEIAACAEFLASDDASFVTGAVLMADGGGSVVDVGTLAFASLG
jgi:NAD(P)-dependent dehydrogenase (short-subunit alcohol dehydrogenase family)